MPFDDGTGNKAFEAWLENPDIEDTLAVRYPAGEPASAPAKDVDPGRARNAAFFNKVYGDCRKGEVAPHLTPVVWLPKKTRQRLPFSKVNGAAGALDAVSRELDKLPASFDVFLYPSAGTYNCRVIAGTPVCPAHRLNPASRSTSRSNSPTTGATRRRARTAPTFIRTRSPWRSCATSSATLGLGRPLVPLRHDAL